MSGENAPRRVLWRRGDLWVVGAVLLAALAALLIARLAAAPGAQAVITTPQGTVTLPLATDTDRVFAGHDDIAVTVEVRDGRVRFVSSGCPDQICVHSGWLSHAGQSAACVPAGIAVQISGQAADGVDAVAQ